MYLPRLRRANDALKEIKESDPNSMLTYRMLIEFMKEGKITSLKYGKDEGTLVKKNNVRRLAIENDIPHIMTRNIIMIEEAFIQRVNPYKVQEHDYKVPRMRCIKDCAREWNKNRQSGDRFIHPDEIYEFLQKNETVFKYYYGNRWIVNYDQLFPYLRKMSQKESAKWAEYMKRIGVENTKTPRKK